MEHYLDINKDFWNARVTGHLTSDFYRMDEFLAGQTSLNSIELDLLGDIRGKKILHLQCHFGQDSLSLQRMGAKVTGVDFSDQAIQAAKDLNKQLDLNTEFICADIFSLPEILNDKFDIVFTSYGTIGWLPNIEKWAKVIAYFMKSGSQFIMAEFHPFIWTFDDDLKEIKYSYFKSESIVDDEEGSYANKDKEIKSPFMCCNHSISEVFNALKKEQVYIEDFHEFNYSPYDVFPDMEEVEDRKFILKKWPKMVPLVYSLRAKPK